MGSYVLDASFPQLFQLAGVRTEEVLRKAGLPEDLFARSTPVLGSSDYLALMTALAALAEDESLAVRLATQPNLEQFSPPVFAAYCAQDGLRFIERIAQYKPLVAPVRYRLEVLGPEATVYVDPDQPDLVLPAFMAEGELAFIVHILRSATKTDITPTTVETVNEPSQALRNYLGGQLVRSGVNALTFAVSDLELPFVSFNDAMWGFFEPELRRRLAQLEIDDTTAARVRAALVELLPAGEATIDGVARKLAVSSRSLQRQL